jgi:hypothetical protein
LYDFPLASGLELIPSGCIPTFAPDGLGIQRQLDRHIPDAVVGTAHSGIAVHLVVGLANWNLGRRFKLDFDCFLQHAYGLKLFDLIVDTYLEAAGMGLDVSDFAIVFLQYPKLIVYHGFSY